MRTIAHIVNPVIVDRASDLYIAQPVTFETMRAARHHAKKRVRVEQYTAQYREDRPLAPAGFRATPNLTRSVMDFGTFRHERKLPLLADILDRLYEATDAEYLIYTNVDIGLVPHFYTAVNEFIEAGADAFSINRRTISGRFTSVREIPQMCLEVSKGRTHPGNDCFVFRRDAYPNYVLGNVCVGMNWVGKTLLNSMAQYAKAFKKFKDPQLTFHIGDLRTWKSPQWSDYRDHNTLEMTTTFMQLRAKRPSQGRLNNDRATGGTEAPAHCGSDAGHRAVGTEQLFTSALAKSGRMGSARFLDPVLSGQWDRGAPGIVQPQPDRQGPTTA